MRKHFFNLAYCFQKASHCFYPLFSQNLSGLVSYRSLLLVETCFWRFPGITVLINAHLFFKIHLFFNVTIIRFPILQELVPRQELRIEPCEPAFKPCLPSSIYAVQQSNYTFPKPLFKHAFND